MTPPPPLSTPEYVRLFTFASWTMTGLLAVSVNARFADPCNPPRVTTPTPELKVKPLATPSVTTLFCAAFVFPNCNVPALITVLPL